MSSPLARGRAELSPRTLSATGSAPAHGAPLKLRLNVYLTRGRLDRRIVAGSSWAHDPALALRATQLIDARTQHSIARSLRHVIRHVDRFGARRVISSVVIEPAAVKAGRRSLVELAEQLERAAPVHPRGVVLARQLLVDALSPLFDPNSAQTVSGAAREVKDALDARHEIVMPRARIDTRL
jgi:hypothetical protein